MIIKKITYIYIYIWILDIEDKLAQVVKSQDRIELGREGRSWKAWEKNKNKNNREFQQIKS